MSSTTARNYADPTAAVGASYWGWWVIIGVLVLVAGLIALGNLFLATALSVLFVGAMMIVSGVAQIVFAFPVRGNWGRFFLWLIIGLFYIVAGVVTFRNPVLATAVLTFLLAASLIVAGIVRTIAGFGLRPANGWRWVVASGVLTLIVGIMIGAGWPVNSLWVLGLFLGIDLVFAGVSYIVFGVDSKAGRSLAA